PRAVRGTRILAPRDLHHPPQAARRGRRPPRRCHMTTASVELRVLDFPAEVEPVVELLTATNTHDQPGWFPSVPGLTNDWSPTSTFDPARDLQALEVDGTLVGLARHTWRERPAVVNHRLEVYVHPEHRRRGFGSRLLAWAEVRARASVAEGAGGPRTKAHQFGGAGSDRAGVMEPFALGHGFSPYRYHFDMRRSLAERI